MSEHHEIQQQLAEDLEALRGKCQEAWPLCSRGRLKSPEDLRQYAIIAVEIATYQARLITNSMLLGHDSTSWIQAAMQEVRIWHKDRSYDPIMGLANRMRRAFHDDIPKQDDAVYQSILEISVMVESWDYVAQMFLIKIYRMYHQALGEWPGEWPDCGPLPEIMPLDTEGKPCPVFAYDNSTMDPEGSPEPTEETDS